VVGKVLLGQVCRKFSFLSCRFKSTNASNSFIYHPGDEQWDHQRSQFHRELVSRHYMRIKRIMFRMPFIPYRKRINAFSPKPRGKRKLCWLMFFWKKNWIDTTKKTFFMSHFTFTSSSSLSSNFHFLLFQFVLWAGIAQSVWRLATGRTVRGSNRGGGEIFLIHADRHSCPPWAKWVPGLIPGVKAAGVWC
jgi:hypothetical protein